MFSLFLRGRNICFFFEKLGTLNLAGSTMSAPDFTSAFFNNSCMQAY